MNEDRISSILPAPEYRPNRRRAQLTSSLLGTFILLDLFIAVTLISALSRLQTGTLGRVAQAELQATAGRLQVLGVIQVIAYLVTGVLFMLWLYRAYQNLYGLREFNLDYTPSWAAAGFIVPILNFWRPYQVMREVWQKSSAARIVEPRQLDPVPLKLKVWWATFLGASLLDRLANMDYGSTTPSQITGSLWLLLAAEVIRIGSAVCAIAVIRAIEERQAERLRQSALFPEAVGAPRWPLGMYAVSIGLALLIGAVTLNQTSTFYQPEPTRAATTANRPAPTPATAAGHLRLGKALFERGEYYAAIDELNLAIGTTSRDAEAYLYRGQAYRETDNYPAAIRDFDRALQLDTRLTEAYIGRGLTYMWQTDYEKSVADFTQAIQLDPTVELAFDGRGWAYLWLDEFDLALADFEQALKLDGEFAEAHEGKGYALHYLGELDAAFEALTYSIELDNKQASAFNHRGLVLAEQSEWTEAVADFGRAIALDKEYAQAYNNRAYAYYELGDFQAAVDDFTTVIQLAPGYADVYLDRGYTYADLRDYTKAIADLEKAIELGVSAADEADAQDAILEFKDRLKRPSS